MVPLEFTPYQRVIASPDLSGRGNLWGTVKAC